MEWLGWDIIEPITYSVQQCSLLLAIRYYLKYHQDRRPENMLQGYTLRNIVARRKTRKDYEFLNTQIASQEKSLQQLQNESAVLRNGRSRSEFLG